MSVIDGMSEHRVALIDCICEVRAVLKLMPDTWAVNACQALGEGLRELAIEELCGDPEEAE